MSVFEELENDKVQKVLQSLSDDQKGNTITMLLLNRQPISEETVALWLKKDMSEEMQNVSELCFIAARTATMLYFAKKELQKETVKQAELIKKYTA